MINFLYEDFLTDRPKLSNSETIQEIKKSKNPLFLFGAGRHAECIYRILLSNKIEIQGVFVDNPTHDLFHGFQVKTFEEVLRDNVEIDVCIGHGNYSEMRNRHQRHERVTRVFDFFDWYGLNWTLNKDYFTQNARALTDVINLFHDTYSKKAFLMHLRARVNNDWRLIQPLITGPQYFEKFISLSNNETFVDAGAYTGTTFLAFNRLVKGKFRKYYAFEPDALNRKKLITLISNGSIKNVTVLDKGCGAKSGRFKFLSNDDHSSIVNEYAQEENHREAHSIDFIEVMKIDDLHDEISFIKMDVEGHEMEALRGSSQTISIYKPKLAISAYHRPNDLFDIPLLIKALNPDYKLFFRLHKQTGADAVFYAI